METDVLIVGAGPTGLVLALWLRKLGVRVRIVDRSEGPGETSRALAVHARTLEFYNQIGLAKEVVAAGIKVESITVREKARAVGHLSLGDFGTGLSPFPFVLALPQDVHERILVACLEREGLLVERDSEVTGFAPKQDRVVATVVRKGKTEVVEAAYLCGCDGAHSMVRHTLGVGFAGGTNPEVFYVADVIGSGAAADGGLDVCMTRDGFCIVLPVRQTGSVRLIGIVPREHETNQAITFDDVRASVSTSTGLSIEAVNWFSTYHVSHRVAEQFRVGRVFLCRGRLSRPQPGRRPGDEHRHRRRGEPCLETRRGGAEPGRRGPFRQLRTRADRFRATFGEDHGPAVSPRGDTLGHRRGVA